jgi:hypothetical protein
MIRTSLGLVKSTNRVARGGQCCNEGDWGIGQCGIDFLPTHTVGIRHHSVETLGELAHGNVAAIAHIGDDRLNRRNRTFTTGIGSRQIDNKIGPGSATKIKTVQHEEGR